MAQNGVTNAHTSDETFASKGKGKASEDVPHTEDMAMDENDSDSDEEEEEEEVVEADEDGMEEIDLNNIVEGGRRTRGATIDFAKAAEENPADDYDEDEDEDFQPPDEDVKMSD
ncbi:histone chaperone domain CHZ-domain-containing protein [Mariannaea sp. PMI_226]|nr:histone chaperone domain CHZ-domain-containing protein [Mariannaea sp. PMI_226]